MAVGYSRAVRGILVLAVMCLATSALGGALAPGETVPASSSADSELLVRAGWLGEVTTWNPMNLEFYEDFVTSPLIYSSLFTYDRDYNMIQGDLAREWSFEVADAGTPGDPSDDYLIVTIVITDNAYWRNLDNLDDTTHPVTADDVKFTFDMIIDEDAGTWPLYLKGIEQIDVLNDYTIEMRTDSLKATIFDDLAGIPIVPEYIWQTYSTSPCTRTMAPDDLVGCGPFVFDAMLTGSWWKFIRAPNYHQTADFGEMADIDYDGILFTTHGSAIELAMAINSGSVDTVVMTGEPNLFLSILGDGSVYPVIKSVVRENGICDVAINAIPFENRTSTYGDGFPLLVDPILREAILMCMDKDFVNEEIMAGLTVEADSVIQPGYWHLDVQPDIPFDPAAARALLEANGYADLDGNGYLECVVTDPEDWRSDFYGEELTGIRCQAPNTDPSYISIAMYWQYRAAEAGIGLVAEEKSEGIMVSAAWYKADYDIWVWHWAWGPEPLDTLSCWLTETMEPGGDNCQMPMGPYEDYVNVELGLNLVHTYDGSIYDQVWTIAGQTMDIEDRRELVFLLQQWVYDSRCEYPPYYDLGLYGFTEAQFTNWGDWSAHNGQTFMSGLPWLWFDLEPMGASGNYPPSSVSMSMWPDPVDVGEPVSFTVTAMDADGDPLTVSIWFGDGVYDSVELSGDTTILNYYTFQHEYTSAGEYEVFLTVDDGTSLPGHVVSISDTVSVVTSEPTMVTVGMLESPSSLNPFAAILRQDEMVLDLMYDTLVSTDPDLASGPRLADYWYTNEDMTVWTFVLNDDARWHDGAPVTASDVAFTYNLILDNPGECALYMDYLEGVTEVLAISDHTVELRLSEMRADMLNTPIPILPEHLWSAIPSSALNSVDPFDPTYFPDGPVGSGPLVLDSYYPDDYLLFTRFDMYHMGLVNVDRVLYKIFAAGDSMVNALQAGYIDVAMDVPPLVWDTLLMMPDIDGQKVPSLSIFELGINCASAEWREAFPKASTNLETTNLAVRQAIAMMVDEEAIVDACKGGLAVAGTSLVPTATPFWHYYVPEDEQWEFNVDAAIALLNSAGYSNIDEDWVFENETSGAELDFKFEYRLGHFDEELAAVMIASWLESIGIRAVPLGITESQLFNEWFSCAYDMFIWGWQTEVDPSFILSVMTTDNTPAYPQDYTKWSDCYYTNPVYDQLYLDQLHAVGVDERQAIVHEMQRILYEDSPYVVLWYPCELYAYRTDTFVYPEMENHPGVTPRTMWFYLELMPAGANLPPQDVDAGPDMTVELGTTVSFNGYAYDPDDPLESLEWDWSFMEASGWGNSVEGQNVEFTFFNASIWLVTLTVTDPSGNSAYDTAVVTVPGLPERSLQYRWHDMFNVPFGEWWDIRSDCYGTVEVISDEYPYIFKQYDSEGEEWLYTNMRLDVIGSAMPEFSMNDDPVLLPLLGDSRGGTAEIDWCMQYMTTEEIAAIPDFPYQWNDGLIVRLNGTVTLDLEAAMAVLGVTPAAFENFELWWSANALSVEMAFSEWMDYEGNYRLDVYNMYEYPFTPHKWSLDAVKVGDEVILFYDHISWGMEALMTRWLRAAFMPTEWHFEDMHLYATIGPDSGDLGIFTAVEYAAYAYTGLDGGACWVWEAMLQDVVESTSPHPVSDFDRYAGKVYMSRLPGSSNFGEYVPYSYTPGAFELGLGETMSFAWPDDYLPFYHHMGDGMVMQSLNTMTVDYLEPSWLDIPGSVVVSNNTHEIMFIGPIDMSAWSENQTTHDYLASEWDRLDVLPYGMPYIEFSIEQSTVNEAPIASFVVVPGMGGPDTEFMVDASSSWDPDGSNETLLVKWDWESDGIWDTSWTSTMVATHVYSAGGWYTISLAVMDPYGAVGYTLQSVLVDATDPIADAGPDQAVFVGDEVVLDGTASVDDFSIGSYSWLFIDDGELVVLEGAVVNYTFTDVGTYLIVLEVTDMVGNSDSDYMVLVVEPAPEPVTVAKLSGGLDSVVSWTFVAGPNCTWSLEAMNYGLSRLDVDVLDLTIGVIVLDETLRFTQDDYWYSGPVAVMDDHVYKVTLRPFGTAGSYAVVTEAFESFYGSMDYVYSSVEGTSVRVDGSSSFEPVDLAESVYDWLRVEFRFVW
jgi:peptide/nickel transport system substrate-binding protein